MSYLVLARKWRPQTFEDVVGQRPVVRTLQNAIMRNRVAHAMIFSGIRGVGKTTLARIMAKALNCRDENSPRPCDKCESCLEIREGRSIDLHEIDGASNRGIQEIRELKENIRFYPTKERFKIIIIDEVHMLTAEAFNALLKTLEEPPSHVYFMFATTELHKVPITILSRCQRYELKRILFPDLLEFLKKISRQENVNISDAALKMVAREAAGSVRDGLSLLDQLFSFSDKEITDEDVSQVLGLTDSQVIENLTEALLAGDLEKSLGLLDRSYLSGIDIKRFTSSLLNSFRALFICRTTDRPEGILDQTDQEMESVKRMAKSHSPETLYHFYHSILKGVEEMQYSSHPRLVLEMTFIKAIQAGHVVPVSSLISRIDRLLDGLEDEEPASGKSHASTVGIVQPAMESVPDSLAVRSVQDEFPPPGQPQIKGKERGFEEKPIPGVMPESEEKSPVKSVQKDWEAFIGYVKDRKQWMGLVLNLCSSAVEEGSDLILRYNDISDCQVLREQENLKLLTELAQDYFQKEYTVRICARGNITDGLGRDGHNGLHEERRSLREDPLVQLAAEIFGGQISDVRTSPSSR